MEVNLRLSDAKALPKMLHCGLVGALLDWRQSAKNGLKWGVGVNHGDVVGDIMLGKSSLRKSFSRKSLKSRFLSAICLMLLSGSGVAQNTAASPERELFNATNRERQAHGLPALQWNDALAVAARKHASEMAQKDALSHQFPGEPSLPSRVKQAGAHFVWLSENVPTDPMHG